MRKIIQSCGDPNLNEVFIDWPLTNWCNYRCSYCPVLRDLHSDFKKPDHTELHNLTLARLKNLSSNFNICITGGEPCLHPQIDEIISSLVNMKNCLNVALFTNLSRSLEYYKSLAQLKTDKLGICASYHPDFANKEKFIEKAIAIKESGNMINVQVSMIDDMSRAHELIDVMDKLIDRGVDCYPLRLRPTQDYTPDYSKEFYQLFRPYMMATSPENQFKNIDCTFTDGTKETMRVFDIEIQQLNKFKGYRCTPRRFQIEMSGAIRNTCTSRQIPLGKNDILKEESCPQDACFARMISFYKEKI